MGVSSRFEIRVLLTAILFLLPITGGLTTLVIIQEREKAVMSTSNNGFAQPAYLGWLISEAQKSLVTVNCKGVLGSGFSFYLDTTDRERGFKHRNESTEQANSVIITNEHVVADCLLGGTVEITIADKTVHAATIVQSDSKNDLALLTTKQLVVPISGASWKPRPGYWTMALGSPHSFFGSVTLGNIINQDSSQVFHTASLSPGNSGGPLLDNEGYLYAVNTGSKPVGQNFNLSVGVNAFCETLIICKDSAYWVDE